MKKLVIVFMAAILLCLLTVPVMAASDEANLSANALYELGLFLGTGKDENGKPNFDLDRAPTRHEAVIMLVRLLGKEEEAKAGTWETPFTDVIDWAEPYVGYAYTNKLTSGTSDTTFGGDTEITVSQYLTFVLRALGYQSGVDFEWDKAWELSDKLGITNGQYNANTAFTRGDVAIISEESLYVPEKGYTAYSDGLAYEINEDGKTLTITGIGTCTDTQVLIPKVMEGKKVTGIGEKAFSECTSITFIKIPETVTSIGRRAFYGCTGITEMTIPASVKSIGTQIFYKASNLHTVYYNSSYGTNEYSVLTSNSITKVVFGGTCVPCKILEKVISLKEVEILDSVTSIGEYAFSGCNSLTSIEIQNSVTSIGEYAFSDCSSLTSIEIQNSVTSIGEYAFSDCSSLTSIELPNSLTNISRAVLQGCNSLTSIVIPDGVISIDRDAFYGCSHLVSIVIPDSVVSIADSAFENCRNLNNVYITDIESWCNIVFGDYYTATPLYYGANLYINNEIVTEIRIPDSVTRIGRYAFCGCSNLISIELPDNVTSIGSAAFGNCINLTSIEISDSVTSIGGYVFSGCNSLTNIHFDGTKAQWNAISNDTALSWNLNPGNYTVYCTDGTITK